MTKCKFPEGGMVFDFFFSPTTLQFEPWSEKVEPFTADFSDLF